MKANLLKFGFTENEAELYTALLKLSEATIDECVEISNVKRTTAYSIAKSLIEKGVIFEIQSKPVRYRALSPNDFLKPILKKRIMETKRLGEEMEELAEKTTMEAQASFDEHSARSDSSQELIVLHGANITKELTRPFVLENAVMRIMSKPPLLVPQLRASGKEPAKIQPPPQTPPPVKCRLILVETEMLRSSDFREMVRDSIESGNQFVRHLPSLPLKIIIFGEVGSITTMAKNKSPEEMLAIVTQNRQLVAMQINAFDYLWEKATPLKVEDLENFK
jgi:sugar-specific transcriptional regulator TrmB